MTSLINYPCVRGGTERWRKQMGKWVFPSSDKCIHSIHLTLHQHPPLVPQQADTGWACILPATRLLRMNWQCAIYQKCPVCLGDRIQLHLPLPRKTRYFLLGINLLLEKVVSITLKLAYGIQITIGHAFSEIHTSPTTGLHLYLPNTWLPLRWTVYTFLTCSVAVLNVKLWYEV